LLKYRKRVHEELRVGVFCPTFNVYGGGEVVAAVIANTLAQNSHDVILFTNEKVNQWEVKKFFGKSLNPSIKAIVQPSYIQPKGLLDFYQSIFRSYILKSKCDIWIDVYSCRIFPWTNISYVHFPFLNHNIYKPRFPYIKSPHLLPIGGLPYTFFEKNLINPNGKLLIANSNYTAEEIKKNSGKKPPILYPPVPSAMFNDNPENLTKNQQNNLVVTISRFDPDKRLEKIPYLASLTDKNIKFAIIGRVQHKETLLLLQKLTKKLGLTDRVFFFTDISRQEMKKILQDAKLYLHTRVNEHFGISVVEAMAMGCVPIVHDSGGTTEFVPDNLRYRTIYEAADKITKVISGWSSRKAIESAKTAEKFKEENFSKDFMQLFNQYTDQNF